VAVTVFDSTRAENSHRFPAFLPDGRHFVFGAQASGDDRENTIRIGSLDSPDAVVLPVPGLGATFAPPDVVLFVRDRTVMAQRIDMGNFEPRGAAVVLDGEGGTATRIAGAPVGSASTNGTLVLGTGHQRPSEISWHYLDGRVEPITQFEERFIAPSVSPDGSRIALMQLGTGSFSSWLFDANSGSLSRLGLAERGLRTPVWDPTGTRLAGLFINAGRNELRVFDVSSGADSMLVQSAHDWGVFTDWSASANVILFSPLVEGRGLDCRYITLGETRTMREYLATNANEGGGALSPDGKWIAYWSDASGTIDLVVDSFPVPSGARRVATLTSTSAGASMWGNPLWWADDGRSVLYMHFGTDEVKSVDVRVEPALVLGSPRPVMKLIDDIYGVDYDAPRRRWMVAAPVGTPRSSLIVIQNWQRQLDGVN
jgi:hypothetical protein